MTVGVAAICDRGGDEKVVLAADSLVTTRQQSAIEHEHQEPKIKEVAGKLPNLDSMAVYSGNVSWAEKLERMVEKRCKRILRENDNPSISMPDLAKLVADRYRKFVRDRIENNLLDHYGIDLEEFQNQHRYKDRFVNDVLTEINNAEEQIKNSLRILLGGVDREGAYIFEIGSNDVVGHNQLCRAAIGSGKQPASTEFMETEYSGSADQSEAIATVTAATMRAQQASGVGGDIDVALVGEGYIQIADEETTEDLRERYEQVSKTQDLVKKNLREHNEVKWRPTDNAQ